MLARVGPESAISEADPAGDRDNEMMADPALSPETPRRLVRGPKNPAHLDCAPTNTMNLYCRCFIQETITFFSYNRSKVYDLKHNSQLVNK